MQLFVGLHTKVDHEIIRFNSFIIFFLKNNTGREQSDEDKGRLAVLLR